MGSHLSGLVRFNFWLLGLGSTLKQVCVPIRDSDDKVIISMFNYQIKITLLTFIVLTCWAFT